MVDFAISQSCWLPFDSAIIMAFRVGHVVVGIDRVHPSLCCRTTIAIMEWEFTPHFAFEINSDIVNRERQFDWVARPSAVDQSSLAMDNIAAAYTGLDEEGESSKCDHIGRRPIRVEA